MKLIDADELLKTIREQEQWNVPDFVYESIQKAPTVKAITVEWIEKQIKRTTDITDEKELDVLYAGNLSYMLKLWEKENE